MFHLMAGDVSTRCASFSRGTSVMLPPSQSANQPACLPVSMGIHNVGVVWLRPRFAKNDVALKIHPNRTNDRLLELRCSLTHCSCEWECRVTPSPPHVVAPRKILKRQTELNGVWYDAEYIVPLTLLELHADYEWLLWWSAKCLL